MNDEQALWPYPPRPPLVVSPGMAEILGEALDGIAHIVPTMGEPHSDLGGSSRVEFDALFNAPRVEQVERAREEHKKALELAGEQGHSWVLTGDGWLVRYARKGGTVERLAPERVNREQRRRMRLPSLRRDWPPIAAFREAWSA